MSLAVSLFRWLSLACHATVQVIVTCLLCHCSGSYLLLCNCSGHCHYPLQTCLSCHSTVCCFTVSGYCKDFADELHKEYLKAEYVLRPVRDGEYGKELGNGSWTGIVGELIRWVNYHFSFHSTHDVIEHIIRWLNKLLFVVKEQHRSIVVFRQNDKLSYSSTWSILL
jgi:hypothetical protein